jgi:hypothetical protein
MNASDFFEKKYGNKTSPNDNWVVRFAEEYHQAKLALADVSGAACDNNNHVCFSSFKNRFCPHCGLPVSQAVR